MKKLTYLFILISMISYAQVGVGTTLPTTTLDVNGHLRIREIPEGNKDLDLILVASENGNLNVTPVENLKKPNESQTNGVKNAYDVIVDPDADVIGERFTVSLDLWSDQALYGAENLESIYFLALRQRVTLPPNITSSGDGKIRKITFVIMQNNTPEGFNETEVSQAFDRWYIIFQTKKYEVESETGNGCIVDDQTYLYEPEKYSSLFVPDPEGSYNATNGDATDARIKMQYQNQIRDRAVVFYDFNGKWVMSVRD